MASNHTEHFSLNQWLPDDQVKHTDFNADNAKIDAASSHPTDVMVYGGRADLGSAPTTSQADHSRTGKREGQAPPLRDGGEAFCAGGRAKHSTPPAF